MDRIRSILEAAKVIAIVGIHDNPVKPASYVPKYLHEQGYRIIGVNPRRVGTTLFGEPVRATLAEIGEAVDIVDVFRRGPDVPEHLDDILAMMPKPKVVWLQLGIRNDEVGAAVEAAGIEFVQDRCTLADHRRLGIPARTV